MIGLLIGLGVGFLVTVIIFSILNYQVYYTFNPFYKFIDNVTSGGWIVLTLIFIILPLYGYVFHDNYVRQEKCNVEWKFDEETGIVEIDITGSKVKDAAINVESKQN